MGRRGGKTRGLNVSPPFSWQILNALLIPFSVVSDSESPQIPRVITICSPDTAPDLEATAGGERRTFSQCEVCKVCNLWFNDGSAYEKHKCVTSTEG